MGRLFSYACKIIIVACVLRAAARRRHYFSCVRTRSRLILLLLPFHAARKWIGGNSIALLMESSNKRNLKYAENVEIYATPQLLSAWKRITPSYYILIEPFIIISTLMISLWKHFLFKSMYFCISKYEYPYSIAVTYS